MIPYMAFPSPRVRFAAGPGRRNARGNVVSLYPGFPGGRGDRPVAFQALAGGDRGNILDIFSCIYYFFNQNIPLPKVSVNPAEKPLEFRRGKEVTGRRFLQKTELFRE